MTTTENNPVFEAIKSEIEAHDVVIFMKGTADFPQCGFSGAVAQIFGHLGVAFKDVNVLEDDAVREGIKEFTNWPTIPQIYVKGEFLGGCDIIREMFENGELVAALEAKNVTMAG